MASVFSETAVDKTEIAQEKLNIKNKTRSNPFQWNGQFSPQLIETLLSTYADSDDVILDPFVGSGTVLLEAGRHGNAALGAEINPAAFMLSRLYHFINVPIADRHPILTKVERLLDERFPIPLLASQGIEKVTDGYLQANLSDLVTLPDNDLERNLIEGLIVLLDLREPHLSTDKVFQTWRKISDLVSRLPYSQRPIRVFNSDARDIPISRQIADLVITSPPYINVLNYHQQYRASVEFLNWKLLEVAKSEIGSNRKHRGNRFLTVIQYCLDMAQCFAELYRICKPEARIILIVGRLSTVRGVKFYNGEIVSEIAERALGGKLSLRQERVFRNKFGQDIFEDILHFSIGNACRMGVEQDFLGKAREVARQTLIAALEIVPNDAQRDLEEALQRIHFIQPSPLYQAQLSNLDRVLDA